MYEFISIIIVAIALSMDTFSVSLSIGCNNISVSKGFLISLVVGIFHYVMPLIGLNFGLLFLRYIYFPKNLILGIIFLILVIKLIITFKEEEKLNLSILGIIFFSFCVSLDAFSTGLGIRAITNHIFISSFIFMIISFSFTFIGILIGKYINKIFGNYAKIFGIIILLILALCLII